MRERSAGDTRIDLRRIPFAIAFQPIVDLVECRIEAFEALVRGPEGQDARSVLDQAGPARAVSLDLACQVRAIEDAGRLGMDRHLSINLLPADVYDAERAIRTVLAAAFRVGFPPDRLIFEVLEDRADPEHLSRIVDTYRRHRLRIALDDLGSGHSSLARLANLQPDIVKIDRALTEDCDRNRHRREVIASLVRLAAQLGIQLVAEGAERREEAAALRDIGVRLVQGFYFGRPRIGSLSNDDQIPWL